MAFDAEDPVHLVFILENAGIGLSEEFVNRLEQCLLLRMPVRNGCHAHFLPVDHNSIDAVFVEPLNAVLLVLASKVDKSFQTQLMSGGVVHYENHFLAGILAFKKRYNTRADPFEELHARPRQVKVTSLVREGQ